jgi:hypothetical protein
MMVKINLNNENHILDFHYTNLTQKKGRSQTVIDRLNRHAKNDKRHARLYTYLRDKVLKDPNGFSILTAKPNELTDFVNNFNTQFQMLSPKVKNRLSQAFYYADYDKWSAYELAKQIAINVCPYCNRSYTFVLGNDTIKGTRFQFDHFLSQHQYPYLALSFYNLVPSCHICNSNLKGSENFTTLTNIHPYLDGFSDNLVFSIKPRNVNFLNGTPGSYRIKFRVGKNSTWSVNKKKAALRNITTFRLTKLYNMHKDYVDDLVTKSMIYNKAYIDSLYNQYAGTLFRNKEDVKRMVLGAYVDEADYHKRVLSKLTADLSKELDLI